MITGYYDVVLGLIPLLILGAAGTGFIAGVSVQSAIIAGSLVAAVLMIHALFVRGPVDDPIPAAVGLVDAD